MKINPNDLTIRHIGKLIELKIPHDSIKGTLTDFYGSFDENDESIIVIEIDEEPYFIDEDCDLLLG